MSVDTKFILIAGLGMISSTAGLGYMAATANQVIFNPALNPSYDSTSIGGLTPEQAAAMFEADSGEVSQEIRTSHDLEQAIREGRIYFSPKELRRLRRAATDEDRRFRSRVDTEIRAHRIDPAKYELSLAEMRSVAQRESREPKLFREYHPVPPKRANLGIENAVSKSNAYNTPTPETFQYHSISGREGMMIYDPLEKRYIHTTGLERVVEILYDIPPSLQSAVRTLKASLGIDSEEKLNAAYPRGGCSVGEDPSADDTTNRLLFLLPLAVVAARRKKSRHK